MNETPNSPGSEDLKATCAALRHQLNTVLILLLIVSGTTGIFFLRQVNLARAQIKNFAPVVAEYQQTSVPIIEEFAARLREYGKTHQDVVPILAKYGVVQVTNTAAAPKK
jgi:hypothetical protein